MGIYDREYYRREAPGFLNSFALNGQACKWLVIANVVVFVIQFLTRVPVAPRFFDPGPVTNALLLDPDKVLHGEIWRLLTYAFLHDTGTWMHIVFNMLFLWWFGRDLENLYGSKEFLTFYVASAIAGGLVYQGIAMLRSDGTPCLGASGAVTAVMVVYAFHFPHRIILVFLILPVPIWAFVIFQVVQDSFVFVGGMKTGTAVTAHLGGALFGFLYYKMHWRLTNLLPSLRSWKIRGARPRLRVFHAGEDQDPVLRTHTAVQPLAPADVDEQLEAKLDAVLEKVARSGQASLTEPERQILMRASEIYKKRRS